MSHKPNILAVFAVAAAVVTVLATPLSAQCPVSEVRYTVIDLGTLGGATSGALDIDEAGRVVGTSATAAGVSHPFVWQNGVMTDLGTLGGPLGTGGAINASGQVTGQSDNAANIRRAYLYSDGEMIELPTLAGGEGRGFDLNDAGQVVGISNSVSGWQHGFLYDHATGTIVDLGTLPGDNVSYANAINNAGQIAGWSSPVNNTSAARSYLLENGEFVPLGTLGGTRSVAWDLDEAGRVVGWSTLAGDAEFHGFLWDDGAMTDLGSLDGLPTVAAAAHAAGWVVGFSTTPAFAAQRAFVYRDGEMADLNSLIPPDSGWELVSAYGVNGVGQVVGTGRIGGSTDARAFLASPATVSVGQLSGLIQGFQLPDGISNSLLAKLDNALKSIEGCTPTGACTSFVALTNEVEAQAGKKLTEEQAAAILAAIATLEATLGCS